jgi:hypothetical protein
MLTFLYAGDVRGFIPWVVLWLATSAAGGLLGNWFGLRVLVPWLARRSLAAAVSSLACPCECACRCTCEAHQWAPEDYEYCAELGHGVYP